MSERAPDRQPEPAVTPPPEPEGVAGRDAAEAGRETRHELDPQERPTALQAKDGEATAVSGRAAATNHGLEDPGREDLGRRILQRMEAADASGPARDPLIGQEIAGRFLVESKIGEGGMGAVYKARQRNMDRHVAIKVLLRGMSTNDTVIRRFQLEALAVSKLKHPNTIQIFDFGETPDGQLYIAMEFLEGTPLQKVLSTERLVPAKRALRIGAQIAKSLREAHGKGIIHRDLKPDNVFLCTVGEQTDFVKVLDFGVAKIKEGDEKQATLTKAGAIFGTPRYMSPEQSVSANVDHRSDLYAIGVILYEMMLGKPPFDADTAVGILIKHMQEEAPSFVQARPDVVLPDEVEALVMRLLSKSPDDRPQSAEALIRELETVEAALDDTWRKVVTLDNAEALGLDPNRPARTQHNTRLTAAQTALGQTMPGAAGDTLFAEPKKRKPWLGLTLGLLGLAGGGAAFTWVSIEPLPEAWRGFGRLADAQAPLAIVGEVPELQVAEVMLTIASDPSEAEVWRDGKLVQQTPLVLRERRGAVPVSLTFKKEGFRDYTRTFELTADLTTTIKLDPIPAPPKDPPPEPRDATIKKPPVVKPKVEEPKAVTPPTPVKPTPVKDPKPNPYDTPRKVRDTKSPY